MYESIEKSHPFLLIGSGTILGSWLRMYITNYFRYHHSSSYFGTVLVNISSAFLLGFFFAVHSQLIDNSLNVKSPLFLFACVGFLGSLSTFSTFIIDLIKTFLEKKLKLCFGLAFFSVFAGLLLALLGLAFGDV